MVLPISSPLTPKARLQQTEATSGGTPELAAGLRAPSASAQGDGIDLSESALLHMGETLAAKGPPFDLETVAKIKQAIAEGRYPIDTQAIADSLFSGYADLLV